MRITEKEWSQALTLDGAQILNEIGRETAEATYNGIGADWMSPTFVAKITEYWDVFAPAAIIHDCEYRFSRKRNIRAFWASNKRFMANCICLAKKRYANRPALLEIRIRTARDMRTILNVTGLKAWVEAGKELQNETQK